MAVAPTLLKQSLLVPLPPTPPRGYHHLPPTPRHTHGAEREPRVRDRTPGHAQDRRHEQHRAEMDDGGRAKGPHLRPEGARLGAEHDHHELQTGQRRGRRADDDVEVLPGTEGRHGGWLHVVQCSCVRRAVPTRPAPGPTSPLPRMATTRRISSASVTLHSYSLRRA